MDMNDLHKRLLTSMAKSLARNFPSGLKVNLLLASFERARSAACRKFLVIFSACCELVDNAVGVDFAGAEAGCGKIRPVRSVGEVLRFEAEPGTRAEA